jgi:amidase
MRDTVAVSSSVTNYKQQQKLYRRMTPIVFPAKPMLGVIGVAPAGSKPIPTMPAGKHGGNLDNNCNGIGSTIYFPVNHPGALLSMGDMHAAQGDGEISGNGVEIGGHVLLQCRVIPQKEAYTTDDFESHQGVRIPLVLEYPVTETATHWITHGVVEDDIPQTTTVACEEAAKLLVGQWGFTIEEAFIFLSVQGNLGLCQSCHPDEGTQIAKMTVPKLPACPRPFRVLYETDTTTSAAGS